MLWVQDLHELSLLFFSVNVKWCWRCGESNSGPQVIHKSVYDHSYQF